MAKSNKELAFLRDLYVDGDWTARFTTLADKNLGFGDDRSVLFLNAGTGNYALEIGNRSGRDARICGLCENADLLAIAREKATATRSKVEFGEIFDEDSFDAIIADASLLDPAELSDSVRDAVSYAEIGGTVAILATAAGSFGEVFSLLWEAMADAESEDVSLAEILITAQPTVSAIEETLADAGLEDVETQVSNELFDFENGTAFIESPLVEDFLMPIWFKDMPTGEAEQVRRRLAELIDEEDGSLSFRFSVKAVLATGRKG